MTISEHAGGKRYSLSFTGPNGEKIEMNDVYFEMPKIETQVDSVTLPDGKIGMTFTARVEPTYDPLWKRELMWATHNLIAHPLSEIANWLAYIPGLLILRGLGERLHDATVPRHAPNTGRG